MAAQKNRTLRPAWYNHQSRNQGPLGGKSGNGCSAANSPGATNVLEPACWSWRAGAGVLEPAC